ncbi:MAG: hypothetical protein U0133_01145 [Gemmatimonadales bacterium]
MRRAILLLTLLALGGCAYYNGMYNTKKLAGRARKAEREGRTFDATSLWGQVGIRAESVLAQHPNSKYADEARLLQATSMARLRNCAAAVQPLELVALTSPNATFREEATVLLGGCRTQLGDPAGAMDAFSRLTNSRDPERRRLAFFAHGQAQRMRGNYAEALEELSGTSYPGAAGERAAALAGLGRSAEAAALVDTLVSRGDTLVPWPAILEGIAAHDPEVASRLTDRLVADTALSLPLRARLLFEDGARWRPTDLTRSEARLAQLERLSSASVQAADSRLDAFRLRVREIETIPALADWTTRLEDISEGNARVAPVALRLAGTAHRVIAAADSVVPGSPDGDLRLFIAAELARDSLDAVRFAAGQFGRVVREWPQSPFAPKALLALIVLAPDSADGYRARLRESYAASPYLAQIEQGASPAYEVLEDSLRRFADNFRPGAARRPVVQPPVQRPDQPAPARTAPREPVN